MKRKALIVQGGWDGHEPVQVANMAYALRTGGPHRANGDMAYHVLEIMHGFHDASKEGRHYELKSTCQRPAPMPPEGL